MVGSRHTQISKLFFAIFIIVFIIDFIIVIVNVFYYPEKALTVIKPIRELKSNFGK